MYIITKFNLHKNMLKNGKAENNKNKIKLSINEI